MAVWTLLAPIALSQEPDSMEVAFPSAMLTSEAAAALLVPERIGPPARVYDLETRSPGAATEVERAVEQRLVPQGAEAPDALRRFNHLFLELSRAGRPLSVHQLFLAEHVGLPVVPEAYGYFTLGTAEPAEVAKFVEPLVAGALKDPDLRALALTLERDDALNGWIGVVSGLVSVVDFEPFPRTVAPGKVSAIPGTLLASRDAYALYVTWPGTEVREYPISGEGTFDLEIPAPSAPGVYRVVMQRQRKRRQPPDSPFFFSLYVGVEPPVAFDPASVGVTDTTPGDAIEMEFEFLAQLNALRVRNGVPALTELQGASASLRDFLARMPVDERQQWRWVGRELVNDPIPATPHGDWYPAFVSGHGPGDTAWMAAEHPISRSFVLDDAFSVAAVGALRGAAGDYTVLAVLTAPPGASVDSRDATFAALSALWPRPGPKPAPDLEAHLDAWAARVASGEWSMDRAFKEVRAQAKKGAVTVDGAYQVMAFEVPAGEAPDLAGATIAGSFRALAIGDAPRTAAGGIVTTVLLVVAADDAR